MEISVMMLTYNREHLVQRTIESILAQTFRAFEFIIVDNGSTDTSGAIAEAYAARDTRIHVIHKERGNIGSGRNAALDVAQGEYLTFIDDDDYAEPDFLEFLYQLAKKYKADVAICGAADKVFEEELVMTAEEALVELMWRKRYNVAFPTKLFRRELMQSLRFPLEGAYDDIALMDQLLAQAHRVAYHGLPKYTFYRHDGNHSAWTTNHALLTSKTLEEYLQAYRTRTTRLSVQFPNSAPAFRYFEWSFMLSMLEKIDRYHISECQEQRAYLFRELHANREEFMNAPYIQGFERQYLAQLWENA